MSYTLDDPEHPNIEASVGSSGVLQLGASMSPGNYTEWVESLRADPDRVLRMPPGTITAREVLERYIDPGKVQSLTSGDVAAMLRRHRRWM